MHAKKTAFVVEHDFIMATYLADRVIVYEGVPSVKAKANSPVSVLSGLNQPLVVLIWVGASMYLCTLVPRWPTCLNS